jgi:glucosamine--fructose-6-phosphate aminotransferase (isomerizing)
MAVTMVDAAELLHFRLPGVPPEAIVVCVSQSGRSAETLRVAERLAERRPRPLVVSVTNGRANPLAALADVSLDTRAGTETGPSTMTFAGSLVVMAALTAALGGPGGDGAAAAAAALTSLLDDAAATAGDLADRLGGRPSFALLARGGARAAAEMGALTLKEAARVPAEAAQAAQFRHGPLELAGAGLAAIVFATEERTRELDRGLAAELAAAGASVVCVEPGGDPPRGCHGIAIGDLEPGVAPAVAIAPAQLVSWELARRGGLDPGAYTLASKVTTRE